AEHFQPCACWTFHSPHSSSGGRKGHLGVNAKVNPRATARQQIRQQRPVSLAEVTAGLMYSGLKKDLIQTKV
ncbi:MAG: hypothetical protein WCD69_12625, partial [Xanthobacteraceae bacterium]